MAKLCLKKQSKRLTCRKKYKIEKKIREHHRKQRKEAKTASKSHRRRPKSIHVPNSCPFKEEVLREAEKARADAAAAKEAAKVAAAADKRKAQREKKTLGAKPSNDAGGKPSTLAELVQRAEAMNAGATATPISEGGARLAKAPSKLGVKAYAGEVKKVIERADVIFEVLDARDPLGSRSVDLERTVIGGNKRLVLLLNKIDLVPRENVEVWLKYLRQQLPTIAFKAATQQQDKHLGRAGGRGAATLSQSSSSTCVGAELVMKLLGNYCRHHDVQTSIRVGVVGAPNVGKSSVINSLKRRRACNVGATPGVTKGLQEVELGRNVRLLDSPGMVLSEDSRMDASELALRNAVKVEQLDDPVLPVEAIVRRCSAKTLMLLYRIPEYGDTTEFLSLVARQTGKLRKGARPDLNAAAKKVLQDWNVGRIRYYTLPPEGSSGTACNDALVGDAQLVSQMAAEFDIDALDADTDNIIKDLSDEPMVDACVLQKGEAPPPAGTEQSVMVVEEPAAADSDAMQCEQAGAVPSTTAVGKGKQPPADGVSTALGGTASRLAGNQQLNRRQKLALKDIRKKKKRNAKLAGKVVDMLQSGAMDLGGDKYDFREHF